MIRIYSPNSLTVGDTLILSPMDAHHVCTVMRKKHGDNIVVFHPKSGEFSATLEIHRKSHNHVFAHVTAFLRKPEVLLPRHMAIPLIKPDKLLLCYEKATELCVTDIHPIITQHSSSTHYASHHHKWQQRIKEAAEQCQRCTLPIIHPLKNLKQCVEQNISISWVTAIERSPDLPYASPEHFQTASGIMVGPEGGFSREEKDYLLTASPQLQRVHLGPTILRAETAALFLLSCLHSTQLPPR